MKDYMQAAIWAMQDGLCAIVLPREHPPSDDIMWMDVIEGWRIVEEMTRASEARPQQVKGG